MQTTYRIVAIAHALKNQKIILSIPFRTRRITIQNPFLLCIGANTLSKTNVMTIISTAAVISAPISACTPCLFCVSDYFTQVYPASIHPHGHRKTADFLLFSIVTMRIFPRKYAQYCAVVTGR